MTINDDSNGDSVNDTDDDIDMGAHVGQTGEAEAKADSVAAVEITRRCQHPSALSLEFSPLPLLRFR